MLARASLRCSVRACSAGQLVQMSKIIRFVFLCLCMVSASGKTNYAEVRARVAQDFQHLATHACALFLAAVAPPHLRRRRTRRKQMRSQTLWLF